MKKKTLAFALLLCILLSQFSLLTFAEDPNVNLSALSVDGTAVDLSSGGTTFELTATSATSVTIAATAVDSTASVTGDGVWSLTYGATNTRTITVTSQDGTTSKSYILSIQQNDTRSSVTTLSGITVGGTAVNGFTAATTSYGVTVASTVTSTTIAATTTDSKAKVTGTGEKTLAYGTNTTKLIVTAENGNTQTYTVVITRTDDRSDDSTLSALTISDATFTFSKSTTSYTVTVASTVESVKIAATASNSKATLVGDGTKTLSYGTNTFKIVVTAENETTKTYTLNISRPDTRSVNNYLSSLSVAGVKLDFVQTTTSYTAIVPNETQSVEITATAADTTSKITGLGTQKLSVYGNTFSIVVSAENGETRTYTLKVIRRDENGHVSSSSSALHRLNTLTVEGAEFTFSPDIYEYTINIDNSVTQMNITATTEASADTWSVTADPLEIGENTVVVSVLNGGTLVNCYTLTVTRDYAYITLDSLARRLGKVTGDTVTVEIHDDNNILTAALLEQLRSSGKKIEIQKYDTSGKLLYSWSFAGADIGAAAADFNTTVNFSSLHKDQIDKLTNDKGCIYLDFSHSGALPAQSTVKIYVGDKYQDGSSAYVYYYNADTEKLELFAEDLTVSGGYVSFSMDHCSEYVITNYKAGGAGLVVILIIVGVLLAAGAAVFILIQKGVIRIGGRSRKKRRKSAARRR
ncbi:MAG: cadherin-like beta sandwich domain-containing protein [Oscillospiraceae bacterium]|nr:cadherin-like beta sandwich domain-containing protein [Oscillospiraceae bacterium]